MNERAILSQVFAESGASTPLVHIGPGDDMALLRPGQPGREVGNTGLLVAVDQVIDGIHFQLEHVSLPMVGRKAMARSLSDVAAMAGRPLASLVSAVLPPTMTDEEAMELFRGMREAADGFRAPIVGGDLSCHRDAGHPMVCSVTVLAEETPAGAVERFGARTGDQVCVTGRLGGSVKPCGGGRHLEFEPRIGEAIMLHAILGDRLHAMIDLSDGLGSDASRVLDRDPGLQIRIDAGQLPCTEGCSWREAVSDGEDYELLFFAEGDVPEQVLECPVSVIGVVAERGEGDGRSVVVEADGQEHDVTDLGWEHAS